MDFYYSAFSGNSARSLFGLLEIGAPFVPHRVDVPGGGHRTADYRAINPMGKVPALIDGPVRLWESNAINCYAAELNPGAGLWPATPAARASVQRWLFFQAGHVSPAARALFVASNPRLQRFWGANPDLPATEAGRKELARYLPVLEDALGGGHWLDGPFSLADIAHAPHLWLLSQGGFDFSSVPRLGAWLERVTARPAWKTAADMIFGE